MNGPSYKIAANYTKRIKLGVAIRVMEKDTVQIPKVTTGSPVCILAAAFQQKDLQPSPSDPLWGILGSLRSCRRHVSDIYSIDLYPIFQSLSESI